MEYDQKIKDTIEQQQEMINMKKEENKKLE